MLIAKWLSDSHIGFFCFRTLTLVWLWISTPNFSVTLPIHMGRGLLIFSDITFKMTSWWPYWIFGFPDLLWFGFEYQIQTSVAKYLCIWVRAYWFSLTSFSKWLPGGHIRFFSFWMAWFRQRNSSLLWNFSFKFHVQVLCGCRQKPNEFQLCRFRNGWLVVLNNVQLQSTHCHPLLWGGGILVDHWSTISSLYLLYILKKTHSDLDLGTFIFHFVSEKCHTP